MAALVAVLVAAVLVAGCIPLPPRCWVPINRCLDEETRRQDARAGPVSGAWSSRGAPSPRSGSGRRTRPAVSVDGAAPMGAASPLARGGYSMIPLGAGISNQWVHVLLSGGLGLLFGLPLCWTPLPVVVS